MLQVDFDGPVPETERFINAIAFLSLRLAVVEHLQRETHKPPRALLLEKVAADMNCWFPNLVFRITDPDALDR